MAENFFWTFLLLTSVCFVVMSVALNTDKDKYEQVSDFFSWGVVVFGLLTIVATIGWIWS